MEKIQFNLTNTLIDLYLFDGIFKPTGTTKLLVDSVITNCNGFVNKKILDLGAGCGVVAISLSKEGLNNNNFYASDLNENTVECVLYNANHNNCKINVKKGSLFEPWYQEKFDLIIDDISGVSNEIAQISGWFDGVPCESGVGGDILTNKFLEDSVNYLNTGGVVFFPVISFSDVESILSTAKNNFDIVECVARNDFMLPDSLKSHLDILEKLKASGYIDFQNRFGTIIWYTEIYKAYNKTY
ncbi:methyltransferase [Candidatus Pseudothioglobus singularis]|nr:methyltransferase [Candidatus Pseudothioglobus singularis]